MFLPHTPEAMNIGVFFGSRSVEHDVSITSAYAVMKVLERLGHDIVPIYLGQDGKWLVHQDFKDINKFKNLHQYEDTAVQVLPSADLKQHLQTVPKGFFAKKTNLTIDCAFPVFHGLHGEDGAFQGMCDILQVPYIGPSMNACAMGMDKQVMKTIFAQMGLPMVPYQVYSKMEILEDGTPQECGGKIEPRRSAGEVSKDGKSNIGKIWDRCVSLSLEERDKGGGQNAENFFVKPVNLGSSIGVNKVTNPQELQEAIELALHYDREVMIEQAVEHLVELNCSVMEIDGQIVTTEVEQPIASADFLSFEQKYLADGGTMHGVKDNVKIPADIPDELAQQIKTWTADIYRRFKCRGGAPRVDRMYDSKADKLYVNEINMIPGVLQLHLWKASGYDAEQVIQTLIDNAFREFDIQRALSVDFQSNIIDHTAEFQK